MLLRDHLNRSTFRIGLLHGCLNALCTFWIAALIYMSFINLRASFADHAVQAAFDRVHAAVSEAPTWPVADVIRHSMAYHAPYINYVLEDSAGNVLAGGLPPLDLGAIGQKTSFPIDQKTGRPNETVLGRAETIVNDRLFIGVDTQPSSDMRRDIIVISIAGLFVSTLIGFLIGTITSIVLQRRIDQISRTSREIMAGNLDRRIPLTKSADQIDELSVSLNLMLDRNEQLVRNIQHVSSDIVHDLRAPLNRLYHRIEVARREDNTIDGLQAAIDHSLEALDSITETFTALLRISEIDTATQRAGFRNVDLNERLDAVIEAFRPAAENKKQSLTKSVAPDLTVPGDPALLAQMFANLLENSIKYAPANASISVLGISRGSAVVVEIADNGPGIPEAAREQVFRPFFRLETDRSIPGTGLGLSLVAAIAKLHNIMINIRDNHPGLRICLTFQT